MFLILYPDFDEVARRLVIDQPGLLRGRKRRPTELWQDTTNFILL